ncbi:MAG: alcohol dehydrogenase catalytic domain-containing protein [Acidimicrobiales bacterium]
MRELTFVEAGRVEWTDRPDPELTDPAAVLVRPTAVARCDLDLPMAKVGLFPVGHETVAEVIAVGDQVTSTRPGDKVLVPFEVSCGQCDRCRRRNYAACLQYTAPLGAVFGFGRSGGAHGGALSDLLFVPEADHLLVGAPAFVPDVGLAMLTDNAVDAYRSVGPPLSRRRGAYVLIVAATSGSIALYAAALASLGAGPSPSEQAL